ncbi:P-loop containing nucleoside triphosphate hydrolase protein [Fomitiporia mediterranea MF3/22]|uniref:P-loop containing nucleoside triphosphate hydrolase protein n=1 Tax=Fomitiporia mediterranea (strain MF3/22) TaxID=694068 RepID=UPI0004407FDE|nr:P-loop containing nucleoside triphosphate hydrolase protein [Fomitiporia mediterranea MF3/22]EJD04570.1 P-loop containing nucleoside triphosphate hydrolase protein [Fomitiporia mediterranea MF3/22]
MDNLAAELAEYLVARLKEIDDYSRLLVGISGIPASGKSTLAKLVVAKCNLLFNKPDSQGSHTPPAILIGLDGWHLTRAQLDAFPDPKLAHDRRGAHWTFDGEAYAKFVAAIRVPIQSGSERAITAPTFDHAVKDPEPDAVMVLPDHRLIVIEGLYAFLSIDPWRVAGEMLDERWFITINIDEATKRLVKRHVITGVAKDMEEAIWRAENNDMPNGLLIIENMLEPTRRIPSPDDPTFVDAIEHEPE